MKTTTDIKFEEIIKLLQKHYTLTYVDYNDNLENSLDKVQSAIHGNFEELDEMLFESFLDSENDQLEQILSELQTEISEKFEIGEEEAKEIIEQYRDELHDAIRERDDSDILKDLLRNTGKQVFFYDTLTEIGEYTTDLNVRLKETKKALKIKLKDKSFDSKLSLMLQQASYGGRLVVYFYNPIKDYMNIDEKINTIQFTGRVNVAVIDNCNGSGDSTEISHSFSLPFNKENLFLDKTVHYSYTYEVCGMFSNWCESTNVDLKTKRTKKVAEKSTVNEHIEKEARLNKVFASGKCTAGDMNYSRHRNTEYINNFPCGTKCKDCGTFFID